MIELRIFKGGYYMKKILICLCLVLLLVTGCGKVPKLENGQEAVVSLKDGDISVDDLYNELKDKYAVSILVDMIDREILNKKYETTKEETDDIDSKVAQMKAQYDNDQTQFLTAIQQYFGVQDEEELRELLSLDYKRGLAIDDYVRSTITDDEINGYYDNTVIGDIKVSHILIKPVTNDSMTTEEKEQAEEEALQKAEEVITKLKNGENFADLAKEYSDDTGSADNGGSLGYINRNSNMVDEFMDAAIALETGKYTTEPVKSTYGYHIILKEDQKEKPELDAVKDDIINTLQEEKLAADNKLQYQALIKLREDNNMEIQDDSLKSQYNTLMNNLLTMQEQS